MITLIGDVHGMIGRLLRMQDKLERSIQLGDVGFGFERVPPFGPAHKFIRGNHDDPALARAHPNYLGDYGCLVENKLKIFYISGANSIDKDRRIPGISWWEDEELGYQEFEKAGDLYEQMKPQIVISHECPAEANKTLLSHLMGDYFRMKGALTSSRTCQALQTMLESHQPDLWVFGHYHVNKEFKLGNTVFHCLGELGTIQI